MKIDLIIYKGPTLNCFGVREEGSDIIFCHSLFSGSRKTKYLIRILFITEISQSWIEIGKNVHGEVIKEISIELNGKLERIMTQKLEEFKFLRMYGNNGAST